MSGKSIVPLYCGFFILNQFRMTLRRVQDERIPGVFELSLYHYSRPLYRHSRVSGNPEMSDWQYAGLWLYRSGFPLARE